MSDKTSELPGVAERPHADVVVYDGRCRICTAQAARLARWDGRGRLAFLSLHDPEIARRYPDLRHEVLMREMVVVTRHGRRYSGAGAVRYLSRRLPRLWWLAPLLHVPFSLPLWRRLYTWVAGRRYRWACTSQCDDGTCSVHRGS